MHVCLSGNTEPLARRKSKKHKKYNEASLRSISSSVTITRTNSAVEIPDVNLSDHCDEEQSWMKSVKNATSQIGGFHSGWSVRNGVRRVKENCAFYKRVLILHIHIWKLLLLWLNRKTKPFFNIFQKMWEIFLRPSLKCFSHSLQIVFRWVINKVTSRSSNLVLWMMSPLEALRRLNSYIQSTGYKLIHVLLSPILSLLVGMKESFQFSMYRYRARFAPVVSVRPSELHYLQNVIPSFRVEFNGKYVSLLFLLEGAFKRTISVNEIAQNVMVVHRKDRRGVYYRKEDFDNPQLIPGWCVVRGTGCAWVLKTLEEWKFLDTAQVKHLTKMPEKYWDEVCGVSVKNGGRHIDVVDLNSVVTDFSKEKQTMYRQWKKGCRPRLLFEHNQNNHERSGCTANDSWDNHSTIQSVCQKILPQTMGEEMEFSSIIALLFYITLLILASLYYHGLKVKQG